MRKINALSCIVLASSLVLTGCVVDREHAGAQTGALSGAVAGGLIGSTIGGGAGQGVASIVGAMVGGAIGSNIGDDMDEQSKARAQRAYRQAMHANHPVGWHYHGYQGQVTMGDGSAFTVGGSWSGGIGGKNAEVWTPRSGWVPFPLITSDATVRDGSQIDPRGEYRDDNHAWLWAAPNGKVFHAGPSSNMHWPCKL